MHTPVARSSRDQTAHYDARDSAPHKAPLWGAAASPTFAVGKLQFQPIKKLHARWLYENLFNDPQVKTWYRNGAGRTYLQCQELTAAGEARWDAGSVGGWMVSLAGAWVGRIGFAPSHSPGGTWEVGYAYLPQVWGKRVGQHALAAALQWMAAADISFTTVMATAHPDNAASNRILQKNGFIQQHIAERPDYDGHLRIFYSLAREDIAQAPQLWEVDDESSPTGLALR
jgi:RimJ/RimL family protein N-acetyltransferase